MSDTARKFYWFNFFLIFFFLKKSLYVKWFSVHVYTGVHFDIFENVKFTCFVFLHELIDMIHVYFKIF